VDRTSAVGQLPALHAVAIRLRDEGLDDHVIAVALGLDDDQVPVLLRIADSKLDHLIALPTTPGSPARSADHAGRSGNAQQGRKP
jgi:hypothetical protein